MTAAARDAGCIHGLPAAFFDAGPHVTVRVAMRGGASGDSVALTPASSANVFLPAVNALLPVDAASGKRAIDDTVLRDHMTWRSWSRALALVRMAVSTSAMTSWHGVTAAQRRNTVPFGIRAVGCSLQADLPAPRL